MFEKLNEILSKDELLLHKVGLILGSIIGLLIGMIISEEADRYTLIEEIEVPQDGETEN